MEGGRGAGKEWEEDEKEGEKRRGRERRGKVGRGRERGREKNDREGGKVVGERKDVTEGEGRGPREIERERV